MDKLLNVPCKGCNLRQIGCHSKCEKYEYYKLRNEEIKRKKSYDIYESHGWNFVRKRNNG